MCSREALCCCAAARSASSCCFSSSEDSSSLSLREISASYLVMMGHPVIVEVMTYIPVLFLTP